MINKGVSDLTVGNTRKLIVAFYVPMLMTNMLQQLYNFVDTIIVGKGLGDQALGAVGNMGSLFFLIIGFSMGLSNGFGIMIAQSYGAKDNDLLKRNLAATIHLSVLITVVLTTLSLIFLPNALVILNTDSVIMGESLRYGYIIFGGLFSSIMYNVSSCVLRSLGDSRTPFLAIIASSVINIILDSFFIFKLHTGVEGAAIATIIAQLISASVCIRKLSTIEMIHLTRKDLKLDLSRWSSLLKNGLPMAFMNSITAIGCMVIQSFVNDLGVDYTSAYSVCSKYVNLFMTPSSTAGHVMSAFSGQNYGAGKFRRIREGLRVCLGISLVSYLIFGSSMVFGSYYLASFILKGSGPIALATSYLPITGACIIFVDFLFVYRSCVQGMGYPFVPMLSGVAEMALRIGTVVFLIGRIGFIAVAFAEVSAWTGALIINMIAFYRILPVEKRTETEHVIKMKKKYS